MAEMKLVEKKNEVAKKVPRRKEFNEFLTRYNIYLEKYGSAGMESGKQSKGEQKADWKALKAEATLLEEKFVPSKDASELLEKSPKGWNNLVNSISAGVWSLITFAAKGELPEASKMKFGLLMLGLMMAGHAAIYAASSINNAVRCARLAYAAEIMAVVEKVLGKEQTVPENK